jgi:hypothetical protein
MSAEPRTHGACAECGHPLVEGFGHQHVVGAHVVDVHGECCRELEHIVPLTPEAPSAEAPAEPLRLTAEIEVGQLRDEVADLRAALERAREAQVRAECERELAVRKVEQVRFIRDQAVEQLERERDAKGKARQGQEELRCQLINERTFGDALVVAGEAILAVWSTKRSRADLTRGQEYALDDLKELLEDR